MNLPDSLIRDFTSLLNNKGERKGHKENTCYGTAYKNGTSITVVLDGSEIPSPASSLVEIENGDRVMVNIKNHSLVIIGNVTNPSLTRLGDVYFIMTEDGLKVGQIGQNGQPTGAYVLISPTSTSIFNSSGTRIAVFGATTQIGRDDSTHIGITSDSFKIFDKDGEEVWVIRADAYGNVRFTKPLFSNLIIDRSSWDDGLGASVKLIPGAGDGEAGNAVSLYAAATGSRGVLYFSKNDNDNGTGHWLIYRTNDGKTLVPDLCTRTVHNNTTDTFIATQKYSDGRLVTDMRVRASINFNTTWGGLYYNGTVYVLPNFPITYSSAPVVVTNVKHVSGQSICMLMSQNTASSSNPGSVYALKSSSGTSTIEITIHAEGMWS